MRHLRKQNAKARSLSGDEFSPVWFMPMMPLSPRRWIEVKVESNLSPVMAGIDDNNRGIIWVTRRTLLQKLEFRGYQRSANSGPVRACLLNAQNKDVVNHRKECCSCVQSEPCKKRQKKGCNWDSLPPKYNSKSQSLFSLYPSFTGCLGAVVTFLTFVTAPYFLPTAITLIRDSARRDKKHDITNNWHAVWENYNV